MTTNRFHQRRCSFVFAVLSISLVFCPLASAAARLHESEDAPPPDSSPEVGATNPDSDNPLSTEEQSANRYLEKYGYISSRFLEGRHAPGSALRRFQSYANIPQTGLLDQATLQMIQKPRCGVPDWNPEDSLFENEGEDFNSRRKRRYTKHGTKWNHNDLTYRIDRYTPDLPKAVVDATIAKALHFWGDVSKLTFTRKETGHVDIRIIFQAGRHGDDEAFDGRGGVLAHAYFPFDNIKPLWGDAHFDDAEQWTVRSYRGQNLLYVAVHEFGHSLGISHSKVRDAIMWPWAGEYIPDFKLKQDDINVIQSIYGKPDAHTTPRPSVDPSVTPTVGPSVDPSPDDSNCAGRIDAIEVAVDGNVYSFKGAKVYKLNNNGVEHGWPKLISQVFPNAPPYVDAALTVKEWETTYLFQGKNYWRYSFKNGRLSGHAGYPRPVTRWGLPENVINLDAAFQWGADDKIYFVKGNRYYSFSVSRRRLDQPGLMSQGWRGLPAYGVTGAMQYTNGRTYFYSRNGVYYRWNDDKDAVDVATPRFPRNTGEWWFGCK